jgi:hypothetical protein
MVWFFQPCQIWSSTHEVLHHAVVSKLVLDGAHVIWASSSRSLSKWSVGSHVTRHARAICCLIIVTVATIMVAIFEFS